MNKLVIENLVWLTQNCTFLTAVVYIILDLAVFVNKYIPLELQSINLTEPSRYLFCVAFWKN